MTEDCRAVAIIPARYGSKRFPGKPLAEVGGRPLIHHVVKRAGEAEKIEQVIVATDDERIMSAVEETSARGVMTSSAHSSGSDRIAAVARNIEADIVVNLQGDEPLIKGEDLDRGIQRMIDNPAQPVVTYRAPCPAKEVKNPDVVKVVADKFDRALYFSRSRLPYCREENVPIYQHVGIYIYRHSYLLKYTSRAPTPLEKAESLEQLRVLENGDGILLVDLEKPTVGIDRPEDVGKVEKIIADYGD